MGSLLSATIVAFNSTTAACICHCVWCHNPNTTKFEPPSPVSFAMWTKKNRSVLTLPPSMNTIWDRVISLPFSFLCQLFLIIIFLIFFFPNCLFAFMLYASKCFSSKAGPCTWSEGWNLCLCAQSCRGRALSPKPTLSFLKTFWVFYRNVCQCGQEIIPPLVHTTCLVTLGHWLIHISEYFAGKFGSACPKPNSGANCIGGWLVGEELEFQNQLTQPYLVKQKTLQ